MGRWVDGRMGKQEIYVQEKTVIFLIENGYCTALQNSIA